MILGPTSLFNTVNVQNANTFEVDVFVVKVCLHLEFPVDVSALTEFAKKGLFLWLAP